MEGGMDRSKNVEFNIWIENNQNNNDREYHYFSSCTKTTTCQQRNIDRLSLPLIVM